MIAASRLLVTLSFLTLIGGAAAANPGRPPRPAPELAGGTQWLNVPPGKALTIAALRNKVILIEFWTGG